MSQIELLRILGWVGLVLIGLTLLASILVSQSGINGLATSFAARLRGWWIMAAVTLPLYALGKGAMIIGFAVVSMGALREFLTLTARNRSDHWAFVASFFLVLPVQFLTIYTDWYGFYAVFIPVYAFLVLPMLSVLRGCTEQFLTRVAQTQWALMVSVFCLSHIPALLFLEIPGFEGGNLLLMIFLILTVQGGDWAQHVWSRVVGHHAIAASISQSRTWEGFIGGVLSAGAIGALIGWLTPFGVLAAPLMGGVAAAVGGMGRMVMIAIKRDRGVTDWGHMADGQGGFLDRLDSVIFAAPIFFHLTRFFWQASAS